MAPRWIVLAVLMLLAAGCHCRPPAPEGPVEWKPAPLSGLSEQGVVAAVTGTGPGDLWIAIEHAHGIGSGTALFHFDGAAWAELPKPAEFPTNVMALQALG